MTRIGDGLSLRQILSALSQLQTWLDEALAERVEHLQDVGGHHTADGLLMAYCWREQALRQIMQELREAACDRFDPPNA